VAINVDAGPVLAPPVLAGLVEAAHATGLLVIAHAEGEGAVRAALTAGIDVLAHVPWTEQLDPDLLRECARQTTWISTLHIHNPRGGGPAWDVAGVNLLEFLGFGGTVRYGTDLGNGELPLGVNGEEILALETLSLSVDEMLAAMTGPLTGPLTGPATGTATSASKFVAGVAPCVLINPIGQGNRTIGPALRRAQVFSFQHMHDWTPPIRCAATGTASCSTRARTWWRTSTATRSAVRCARPRSGLTPSSGTSGPAG
jgi:hypothetical protein